jgi:N-acetylglucosamine kinase-like BadF-type ATPase
MKYIIAIDGGGTKTRVNVVDLEGNIIFDKETTGCNIMAIGDVAFKILFASLFKEVKEVLGLDNEDINQVYLGLSGADLKEDYERLERACKQIFIDVNYTIVNDAWIIMRSGLQDSYGAVCICGTGTNSAATSRTGDKAILRALSFVLGTYGGGLEIAKEALHYAFRADELSYKDTMLRTKIPELLGYKRIREVIPLFYPKRVIDKRTWGSITPLVSECAIKGDQVSIDILVKVATHIALQTLGVMKQVHIENEHVPVVIGGRVFTIEAPIFMETFNRVMLDNAPHSYIVKPRFTPVIGAYLFALDKLRIKQTKEIEQNLMNSGGTL